MKVRVCRKPSHLTILILLSCAMIISMAYNYYTVIHTYKYPDISKKDIIPDQRTPHPPKKAPSVAIVKEVPAHLRQCLGNLTILPSLRIFPKKEVTTLEAVNADVIGDLVQKANSATNTANRILPSLFTIRRTTKKTIDRIMVDLDLVVDLDDYRLLPGGHWIPLSCKPRWRVAIVTPFRNRHHHLPIFLRHIIPFLKRQNLEFSIFVAEQRNDMLMNRAMMRGIGFLEALNFTRYDCVIFNDIDHLPINIKNYYGCDKMPRHFISGEAKWRWDVLYETTFGGAFGATTRQFYAVNGMPNVYWGWGGEDDDFGLRLREKGFKPSRPQFEIGYFETITTNHENKTMNKKRRCMCQLYAERMDSDGLSNLKYDPPFIELHPLYTNISVNIHRLPWKPEWTKCDETKKEGGR